MRTYYNDSGEEVTGGFGRVGEMVGDGWEGGRRSNTPPQRLPGC